jgi:hypothetical protein
MSNSVDQQVIDFTAVYTSRPVEEIHNSTILANIGINTPDDLVIYLTELEDSFKLVYEPGDEVGIVTVGNAAELIEKKLG